MSKKTWAVVVVSAAILLLVLVGVVLLGLAISGRLGPGIMTRRSLLLGRRLPGTRGLLGGSCPWCRGVAGAVPGRLGGLLMLLLLCSVPLGLLAVAIVVVWWALRQRRAPPPSPGA